MKKPVFEEILEVYKRKNYNIFDNGIPINLNIGGIRTNDMNPNKFNDWIYCFYKDESGKQKFHCWPAATDPGLYYLRFPFQPEADQPLAEYKKGLLFLHRDNILDAGG